MPHNAYTSPHIIPTCPVPDYFPEEIESWLFNNFLLLQRAVFVTAQLENVIDITNTTTEIEVGHLDIAPNQFHISESFLFNLIGVYSNASASDNFTIKVKLNGVVVDTILRNDGNQTDAGLDIRWQVTNVKEGTAGEFYSSILVFDNGSNYASGNPTVVAIDTTISNTLSVTFQWDNAKAGNTVKFTSGRTLTFHPNIGVN